MLSVMLFRTWATSGVDWFGQHYVTRDQSHQVRCRHELPRTGLRGIQVAHFNEQGVYSTPWPAAGPHPLRTGPMKGHAELQEFSAL